MAARALELWHIIGGLEMKTVWVDLVNGDHIYVDVEKAKQLMNEGNAIARGLSQAERKKHYRDSEYYKQKEGN